MYKLTQSIYVLLCLTKHVTVTSPAHFKVTENQDQMLELTLKAWKNSLNLFMDEGLELALCCVWDGKALYATCEKHIKEHWSS